MAERALYLDYAATTPVDARVAERMRAFLSPDGEFGNPASMQHAYGRVAHDAVEKAREQVASLIGAEAAEIVWTSGATESNNLAIKGVAEAYADRGRHMVTMKTEHKSVVDVCRYLEQQGWRITWLPPQPDGRISTETLAAAINEETVLVSLMLVNNETGVLQDIASIGRLTRERGVLLHVDAAQAVGKMPVDVEHMQTDLLSVSAHKLYGPKGIGALYVRRRPRARLMPQIHGGGHERGMRSGTLPTHQIVGMGEACRIADEAMAKEAERIRALRDRLWQGLSELPEVYRNGSDSHNVAGILNVSFAGVDGEALHAGLSGLAVPLALSSGSACTAASQESSYVLRALGREDELAYASVRFSLGRWTTQDEVDRVITSVQTLVNALRRRSPAWQKDCAGPAPGMGDEHPQYSDAVWRYFTRALAADPSEDEADLVVASDTPGSRARMQLRARIEGGKFVSAEARVYGCVSSLAAGAWLAEYLIGKSPEQLQVTTAEIEQDLQLAPVKRHCALMAEDLLGMISRQARLTVDAAEKVAS